MQVFLIAVLSADGYLADDPDIASTSWTSKEDAAWFAAKTKEAGVVVMGNRSYQTLPEKYRPLKDRLNIVYSHQNQNNFILQNSQQLENLAGKTSLIYTNLPAEELVEVVKQAGFKQLAICGGASIYRMFMEAGVVNKIYLTVEPVFFGGGIKLFGDKGSFPEVKNLSLVNTHRLSPQTMVLEYQV